MIYMFIVLIVLSTVGASLDFNRLRPSIGSHNIRRIETVKLLPKYKNEKSSGLPFTSENISEKFSPSHTRVHHETTDGLINFGSRISAQLVI